MKNIWKAILIEDLWNNISKIKGCMGGRKEKQTEQRWRDVSRD